MADECHRSGAGQPPTDGAGAVSCAFRILSRRDHTCKELTFKLRQKGFGRPAVDHALARCRELGYIDDAKTARLIAGRLTGRGYGPLRIRQTLLQKGVDEAVVHKVLACCGDEADQVRAARRMLSKMTARLARETDPHKRRQKACRYLMGRGFAADVVHQAVAIDGSMPFSGANR